MTTQHTITDRINSILDSLNESKIPWTRDAIVARVQSLCYDVANEATTAANEKKRYNGWSNYETWCTKLWMDNDSGSYDYWEETAKELWENAEPKYEWEDKRDAFIADMAERLQSQHEEDAPTSDASVYTDLLNTALGEIDWREIAATYVDEFISDIQSEHQDAVKGPGKFEGQPAYVHYFHEMSMEGSFDTIDFADTEERIDYAEISENDTVIWPELAPHVGEFILLSENDQGFVTGTIADKAELDRLTAAAAAVPDTNEGGAL